MIFLYHLKIERNYSPFLSAYITFGYLFFLLAPMVQIKAFSEDSSLFPNSFPYSESAVTYANIIILLFHIIFFFGYLFFKKRYYKKTKRPALPPNKFTPLTLIVILIVGIVTFIMSYDYWLNLISESHWRSNKIYEISVSSQLMLKKVLYMMPLGAIVLGHDYLKRKKIITNNSIYVFLLLMVLFAMFIVFKNPLTEKRNSIGPIYITLLFLFSPKLLNSNTKSFLFLFFSMVILFPLVSGLTHLDASIGEIMNNPELILDHYRDEGFITTFNTLHYDAFANVMATIDYVFKNGLTWGYQLLSGLLFFVPRSIWASKPNSTGEVIGDYVIEDYGFVYSNLSNPLVAEGYINFGIIGVVIMAFALAFFIIKLMNWLNSESPLKRIMGFYFAVHLLFLLRGDFTNGFSYYIGTLFGVMVIPSMINKFLKMSFKKKHKQSQSD
ncbi:MAG: O-antigen polysaccharide polymerase Wzy [Bacteroidia bacterium]|nr:O-antigen polysaccharide polymerase Wzy [Bacteroidia bacterium]MBT8279220.1 O-antigen polysaccharide polymerase Wzy [Bacteroidia bacterium]NND25714.1 O-antigen polysaccharide polymerase Wzy [Flavobacteriaceae bacterium]NNK59756.1 O-antigen polysaccharide polymerase Wzy [Flavobacteriaceae bacterium]NNL32020.1 O-antigen polysaccharide polymerase Wzy [Flavobacteriaceae bacterium]